MASIKLLPDRAALSEVLDQVRAISEYSVWSHLAGLRYPYDSIFMWLHDSGQLYVGPSLQTGGCRFLKLTRFWFSCEPRLIHARCFATAPALSYMLTELAPDFVVEHIPMEVSWPRSN